VDRPSARASALDLLLSASATVAGVVLFVRAAPRLRELPAPHLLAMATLAQILVGEAVPLLLVLARRESFESLGFTRRRVLASLLAGVALAATYDACVSFGRHELAWIPFRRHGVLALAATLDAPWNVAAAAGVVLVWGVLEGDARRARKEGGVERARLPTSDNENPDG
jgi:hypothetical protein